MDADLTHNPAETKKMVDEIAEGYDLIVGSRYVDFGKQINVLMFRQLYSKVANSVIRLIFSVPVKDVTSGYQCYRYDLVRRIIMKYGDRLVESKGFAISPELLVKSYWVGASIREVSITLDYAVKKRKEKTEIFPSNQGLSEIAPNSYSLEENG